MEVNWKPVLFERHYIYFNFFKLSLHLGMNSKLCCCGNNSSHSLISSLDRWRAGSQVHDDMGHPFHLIRYSISYEKINKKWNGRLKTSLGKAAFKEAVSTYFAAFPLRKQSFSQKHFYLSSAFQTTCRVVSSFLFRNCLILLF